MLQFGDRFGFRLQSLQIPCPSLSRPLRILHLSDTHICVADKAKQRFLKRVTDDDYDFVFFTGDITEEPEAESLVPGLLSRQPRHGAYAVLGNHDYARQSFWVSLREIATGGFDPNRSFSDGHAMKRNIEAGDRWRVLMNEAITHEIDGQKIVVAGVDDPYTDHGDLQHTMRQVKQADVLIGLVHVPTDLASFSQRGFHAVFAGHTHGGQIRLPGIGAMATSCDLPKKLAMGLHYVERTAVHVSAGLGAGKLIRTRFLCPPTAYAITLGGKP